MMWCLRPGDCSRRCSNSKKFQGPELTDGKPKETVDRKTMGLPVLVPRSFAERAAATLADLDLATSNDVFMNMAHGRPAPFTVLVLSFSY